MRNGLAWGCLAALLAWPVSCLAEDDDTVVESPEDLSQQPLVEPAPEDGSSEASSPPAAAVSHEEPLWLQEPAEPVESTESVQPPSPVVQPPPTETPEPPPNPGQEEESSPVPVQADPTFHERRAAEKAARKEPDQHVVSQSRMFSVSGGDSLRMGAIATRADDIQSQVYRILDLDSQWKHPVSIRLIGQPDDPPIPSPIHTRIRIIGQEPVFQIRIHPGGGINISKLNNAIITMVLYEYALRQTDAADYPDALHLPDWLLTGLQQAILWKTGKADRRLYRNLFNRAEMLDPETIVGVRDPWNLDASSYQVYEVSCGVLVLSLINRPGGVDQLKSLLEEAISEEGTPAEIVARHFHELGIDGASLTKWWALELAALSLPRASELLTPLESEKQLAEALLVHPFQEEEGIVRPISIDNVYALVEIKGWQKLVRPSLRRLAQLNLRCFPGYRAIILEYSRAINELAQNNDPDAVQNIIGPLRALRAGYVKTATRARDYLDWYEVSHLGRANSRSFDSYMDAMRLLRQEPTSPKCPISRYLEDIETLYQLQEGEALPDSLLNQIPQRRRHEKERKP